MASKIRTVLFTGIRGSGKSTLIQQLKNFTSFNSIYFDSYSNLLKSFVEKDSEDFSLFDSFSFDVKKNYRQKVISHLESLSFTKLVFIEGHLAMYNTQLEQFETLFHQSDLNFFDLIIYYDISAQTIFDHRIKDVNKSRLPNLSIIQQEIAFEEEYLSSIKKNKSTIKISSLSEIKNLLLGIMAAKPL
jgi:uridine kinase